MRYLVECLGHSAFILEFYIAFDIILICLTLLTSISWETPLKVTSYSPQYDSSGFLSIHQCNVDKCVRVADARWE